MADDNATKEKDQKKKKVVPIESKPVSNYGTKKFWFSAPDSKDEEQK